MSVRPEGMQPSGLVADVVTRYGAVDPGFVRMRRSLQCVGAAAATWSFVFAVTSGAGVGEPFRIALFGAGTCLFGALMINDPRPSDRVRTFGWAAVVAVVAVVLTVYLGQVGVWAAAVFLVVQMFLSFALRAWSVRAGSLAGIGALTTFVASGGHISVDRMGWFTLASTVGFAWLALWQRVLLSDRPCHAIQRGVRTLDRLAADVVACAGLPTTPGNLKRSRKGLHASLERVISCRRGIDAQLSALVLHGVRNPRIDDLRATLYSVQAALERLVDQVEGRAPTDSAALGEVARSVQQLREHLDEGDPATGAIPVAADPVIETSSQTTPSRLSPTTVLAVQAVVASVSAGLIALWVGIEQSRVVAYTAFLVIAASAGTSIRRAWTRVVATALGATAGVLIAATVPRNPACIGAVFAVGVFCTVFTAPVSNAAMVFWLSIATVPLAATEGLYLDLVKDKTLAALIAGCVTAVVVLTVVPIRLSKSLGPALLTYLDALDAALEALLPSEGDRDVWAAADLDSARSDFDVIAESAADEIDVFRQSGGSLNEQRSGVDAVHEAFLRLVPLFDESSTRVFGWTRDDVDDVVGQLRVDVEAAKSAVRGEPAVGNSAGPMINSQLRFPMAAGDNNLELAGQRQRINNLHSALTELAGASREHRRSQTAAP